MRIFSALLCLVATVALAKETIEVSPAFVGDRYSIAVTAQHPMQRYFYFPPKAKVLPGEGLAGLVIALPGGLGSEDSRPYIGGVYLYSLPDDFAMIQLINPIWRPDQKIMWPTDIVKAEGMEFTTPEFIDAVLDDVQKLVRVDPNRVYLYGRSSGGGSTYYAAIANPRIRGALVVASVFRPQHLPPLDGAAGKKFFLYQSPDDEITPFSFAEKAYSDLRGAGADVMLETYEGGHYYKWPRDRLRVFHNAFRWLQSGAQLGVAADAKPAARFRRP